MSEIGTVSATDTAFMIEQIEFAREGLEKNRRADESLWDRRRHYEGRLSRRFDEIVAEHDRLRALNAELVEAMEEIRRVSAFEMPEGVWAIARTAITKAREGGG